MYLHAVDRRCLIQRLAYTSVLSESVLVACNLILNSRHSINSTAYKIQQHTQKKEEKFSSLTRGTECLRIIYRHNYIVISSIANQA